MENVTDHQGYLIYDNCRVTCLIHARNILMKALMNLGYQFHATKEENYLAWYSRTVGGFCKKTGEGLNECIVQIRRASNENKEIGIIKWINISDTVVAEIETSTHEDVNNSTNTDATELNDDNSLIVVDTVIEDVSENPVIGGL